MDRETESIIEDFLRDRKAIGRSEITVSIYKELLYKFFTDCQKKPCDVEYEDVRQWLEDRYSKSAPRTVEQRINLLAGFFMYCVDEELADIVPLKKRWHPKIPASLPKYLTDLEMAKISIYSEKLGLRDRAILELLKSSGIRRQELVNLNISVVDLNNRTIVISGKGNKERIVHFSDRCASVLLTLIDGRYESEEPLFVNIKGKRLTTKSIYNIVKNAGLKAGIKKPISPHALRHTFATRMVAKGANLHAVSGLLGHSSLNTTRIYARIPSMKIVNLYRKIFD